MREISKRTAVARIIADLIKADNIIDEKEMRALTKLEDIYHIHQKDLVAAQLITFSDAISVLRERMDQKEKTVLLDYLCKLARIDDVCTLREALILVAVHYCLDEEHSNYSEMLTCESNDIVGDGKNFIVYIESEIDKDINSEIKDDKVYHSMTVDINKMGMDFVYIPYLVREFRKKNPEYVMKVLEYMSPGFSEETRLEIYNKISNFTTTSFTQNLLCKKMGVSVMNTEPALLINIGSSLVPYCGNQSDSKVFTEFLRINITDSIYGEVRHLMDSMNRLVNEKIIASSNIVENRLKYFGFYKAMLDLMIYTKSDSDLLINLDSKKDTIRFVDSNEVLKLKPQESALYILMIEQSIHDEVNKGLLYKPNDRQLTQLNKRYREIYESISGSRMTKDFNSGITQAVSHIRKAIKETLYLKNINTYLPIKDEENGVYRVNVSAEQVVMKHSGIDK